MSLEFIPLMISDFISNWMLSNVKFKYWPYHVGSLFVINQQGKHVISLWLSANALDFTNHQLWIFFPAIILMRIDHWLLKFDTRVNRFSFRKGYYEIPFSNCLFYSYCALGCFGMYKHTAVQDISSKKWVLYERCVNKYVLCLKRSKRGKQWIWS